MLALPEARLAVGVKVAVRVRPLPLISLSVPPVTTTSPSEPFQAKLMPGSSLNEKVMVAVSSDLSASLLLVMERVGARVSRVRPTTSAAWKFCNPLFKFRSASLPAKSMMPLPSGNWMDVPGATPKSVSPSFTL